MAVTLIVIFRPVVGCVEYAGRLSEERLAPNPDAAEAPEPTAIVYSAMRENSAPEAKSLPFCSLRALKRM